MSQSIAGSAVHELIASSEAIATLMILFLTVRYDFQFRNMLARLLLLLYLSNRLRVPQTFLRSFLEQSVGLGIYGSLLINFGHGSLLAGLENLILFLNVMLLLAEEGSDGLVLRIAVDARRASLCRRDC